MVTCMAQGLKSNDAAVSTISQRPKKIYPVDSHEHSTRTTKIVATYAYSTEFIGHFYCKNPLKAAPQRPNAQTKPSKGGERRVHRRGPIRACYNAEFASHRGPQNSARDIGNSPKLTSSGGPLWRCPLSCCRNQAIRFLGRHMRLNIGVEQTPDHSLVLGLVL